MSTHTERIAELGMEDLRWVYRVKRVHDDATDAIAQMEWDAVIAAHDRAVKAEALREAAEAYSAGQISGLFIGPVDYTKHWLRYRADEMEKETTDD